MKPGTIRGACQQRKYHRRRGPSRDRHGRQLAFGTPLKNRGRLSGEEDYYSHFNMLNHDSPALLRRTNWVRSVILMLARIGGGEIEEGIAGNRLAHPLDLHRDRRQHPLAGAPRLPALQACLGAIETALKRRLVA